MSAEELVALYDPDDVVGRVVGAAPRSRMRAENLCHGAASVILRRSDGRILVHRRAQHKDLWPGRHDLACGGVIAAGESPEACARRELAEEVGVDGVEPRPVLTTWYRDGDTQALVFVFDAVWDGPVHFADGEVDDAWWMRPDELEALLAGPQHLFVPDSRAIWRLLAG